MAQKVKETRTPRAARRGGTAKQSAARQAGGAGGKPTTRVPGETTISSQNQVTIPVAVLRRAKLAAGDRVRVEVDAVGRLRIAPLDMSPEDVVRRLAEGALPDLYPDGFIDELREEDRSDRW